MILHVLSLVDRDMMWSRNRRGSFPASCHLIATLVCPVHPPGLPASSRARLAAPTTGDRFRTASFPRVRPIKDRASGFLRRRSPAQRRISSSPCGPVSWPRIRLVVWFCGSEDWAGEHRISDLKHRGSDRDRDRVAASGRAGASRPPEDPRGAESPGAIRDPAGPGARHRAICRRSLARPIETGRVSRSGDRLGLVLFGAPPDLPDGYRRRGMRRRDRPGLRRGRAGPLGRDRAQSDPGRFHPTRPRSDVQPHPHEPSLCAAPPSGSRGQGATPGHRVGSAGRRDQRPGRPLRSFPPAGRRLAGRWGSGHLADPLRIHGRELRRGPQDLPERARHAPADPPLRPIGRAVLRRAGHLGGRRLREDAAAPRTRGPHVVRRSPALPRHERIGPSRDAPLCQEVDGLPRQRRPPACIRHDPRRLLHDQAWRGDRGERVLHPGARGGPEARHPGDVPQADPAELATPPAGRDRGRRRRLSRGSIDRWSSSTATYPRM